MEIKFQKAVKPWTIECFGKEIASNKVERNHRFLEESLELAQSCGATKEEALQLVDYVFSRAVGLKEQEVGGVMVTLAALCNAQNIDMEECAIDELDLCWKKIEKIREKQKNKPKFSPLPQ